MTTINLSLPDDLEAAAAAQAARSGLSLNDFIALAVAGQVASQTEAARYFAARAARVVPGQAEEILARAGRGNPPRDDDRLF